MSIIGDLVTRLTANLSGLRSGLNNAQQMHRGYVSNVTSTLGRVGLAGIGLQTIIGGVRTALSGLAVPIGLAAEFEQTQVAFRTLLKDVGLADQVIADLTQFAATTPFQTGEINATAKALLAFQTPAEQLIPTLRSLGDVAALTGQPIGEIAAIYGKARVQGRLFAEDINQFTGRGIPIIGELAKQFGVAETEVRKLVESGKVNFDNLEQAFAAMTAEGGQFSGGMQAQSQTLAGLYSTLKDNVLLALREIGIGISESFDLKAVTQQVTVFAQQFVTTWVPPIVSALGTLARWVGEVATFFMDLDLFVAITFENMLLFVDNTVARFQAMVTNIGILLQFLRDNWQTIILDLSRIVATATINMAKNFGGFFKAIIDFAKGKGFNFKATGLLDGVRTEIQELPDLVEANIRQTNPTIDGLLDEFVRRQEERMAKPIQEAAAEQGLALRDLGLQADAAGKKIKAQQTAGLALQGTQEAFRSIFDSMRMAQDPQKQLVNIAQKTFDLEVENARTLQRFLNEQNQVIPVTL